MKGNRPKEKVRVISGYISFPFVFAMFVAFAVVLAMTTAPAFAVDNYAWVSKGPVGTDARHLVCSANNPGVVYAGTNGGVYKTTDYGDNWFYSGLRFRAIDALRGSGGCNMGVFAGASGDVFQTTDGGHTWNVVFSVPSEISALVVTNPSGDQSNCIGYVGTRQNGVFNNLLGQTGLAGIEITALAVDSNNYVYAGTSDSGVWKTTDNGQNWVQVNNGLTDTQIFSLKIDGSDRIFAGTFGGGVFRSTDGGGSWELKNSGLPAVSGIPGAYAVFSFAKDSNNNIYAGVLTDIPPVGTVYKSTNNGDNWNPTNSAIDGYFPESMCATPDNILFVGTNMGLFKTDNAGTSWTNQTNKISAIPFNNTFAAYNGTIFIGADGQGVYKSTDGGETWAQTGTGGPQCIGALLADGSGNLYASTCDAPDIYKSGDGGGTWTVSSNGVPKDGIFIQEGNSFAIDGGGNIYVGLDSGEVYKTIDQANNWVATGVLPSNTAHVTALAGMGASTILAGTGGNGIYKTVNGGTTWQQKNTGLPPNAHIIQNSFFVDKANPGYIFVGPQEGGLYRSIDGGESWAQVMASNVSSCDVRSVMRGTLDTTFLYAVVCRGAIFKSNDNGATWTTFSNNGLKPWDFVEGINVRGIFGYSDAVFQGVFVAATESSGMYKFSKDLAIIKGKPGYYASLQDAYNAAAQSGDSILALAVNFYSENLLFDTVGKSIVLSGGYDAGFAANPGMTSIKGPNTGMLTVSQGDVTLQNIILGFLIITEQGKVYAENVVVK